MRNGEHVFSQEREREREFVSHLLESQVTGTAYAEDAPDLPPPVQARTPHQQGFSHCSPVPAGLLVSCATHSEAAPEAPAAPEIDAEAAAEASAAAKAVADAEDEARIKRIQQKRQEIRVKILEQVEVQGICFFTIRAIRAQLAPSAVRTLGPRTLFWVRFYRRLYARCG